MGLTDLMLFLRLPSSPQAAGTARASVAGLAPFLEPVVVEHLQLLVSELVGNAVRHGRPRLQDALEVSLRASPETVLVEVTDQGHGFARPPPEPGRPPPQDTGDSGWGLFIVDRVAQRWGIVDGGGPGHGGGVRVWFELSPGVRQPAASR